MKKLILSALFVSLTIAAFAVKIPFSDPFDSSGPKADWEADTAAGGFKVGTLTTVNTDVDWRGTTINPPAGGDGYFGKFAHTTTVAGTAWRLVGEGDEKDMLISCKMFIPVVNAFDATYPNDTIPDDFLYQSVIFHANGAGYCRLHFHLNTAAGLATQLAPNDTPRIRMQSTYGGFFTPLMLRSSAGEFTATEKWWDIQININGNNAELFLDGVSKGTADFSTKTDFATGGQQGISMYIDDASVTARQLYVDNFQLTGKNRVEDWTTLE